MKHAAGVIRAKRLQMSQAQQAQARALSAQKAKSSSESQRIHSSRSQTKTKDKPVSSKSSTSKRRAPEGQAPTQAQAPAPLQSRSLNESMLAKTTNSSRSSKPSSVTTPTLSQNQPPSPRQLGTPAPARSNSENARQAQFATVQAVLDGDNQTLPQLHFYTYKGDMAGVERVLNDGAEVNATVVLPNEFKQLVHGVTALYLAAQYGHMDIAQLLVARGADASQKCWIPNTKYEFSPAESALLHLNLKVFRFITSSTRERPAQQRASGRRSAAQGRRTAYLVDEDFSPI